MKLKPLSLSFLVFCLILYPICIWANDSIITKQLASDLMKPQTEQSTSNNNNDSKKNDQLPEASKATTDPFFKDATYEKFEPQKDRDPPFDLEVTR